MDSLKHSQSTIELFLVKRENAIMIVDHAEGKDYFIKLVPSEFTKHRATRVFVKSFTSEVYDEVNRDDLPLLVEARLAKYEQHNS